MDKLYYIPPKGKGEEMAGYAFLVEPEPPIGNSVSAEEMVKNYLKKISTFSEEIGVESGDVRTFYINHISHLKNRRIWFAQTNKAPRTAEVLDTDLNMWDWLN